MKPTSATTTPVRRLLVTAAAVILSLSIAGCSGDESDDSGEKPAAGESASADATVPSGDNGDLANPVGARSDLVDFSCKEKGGTWSAKGTLQNSSGDEATYLVQVSVHSAKAGTVFGSKDDTIEIKAGKKSDFELDGIYAGKEKKVDCTARVVRSS